MSIRKGIILEGSKISLQKFILLTTLTYQHVQDQSSVTSGEDEEGCRETRSNTINTFNEIFRNMVCDQMLLDVDNKIGRVGLTVEVDESLFGKRKYHRGSCKGRGK